jgi:type IV secretory pathway protease TraF
MSRDPARLGGQMTVFAIVSIALVATIAVPPNARLPWLIYNASGNAQLSFYGVGKSHSVSPRLVVVRLSVTLENLLANHGVLPRAVSLLKHVIAVGGAQICRSAGVAYVNGAVAAEALDHDCEGRPLPFRQGCARLFEGPFFNIQPIPIPSTAGISGRSATAKLSASHGRCGLETHRNDTPVLPVSDD